MSKRFVGFYLTIAIIGIITAIPFLGDVINVFNVLTFVLLGFSIYLLAAQPKEVKKRAAVLMIISCGLSIIGWFIFALGGASAAATADAGQAIGSLVGGSLLSFAFALPAWVLRILAVIFSFIAVKELKRINEIKGKHQKKDSHLS